MIEDFACPTCGGRNWKRLEEKHYYEQDSAGLDPYAQTRYQILFGAWFKGQEVAHITSVLCLSCGFVTFAPRPTEAEVHKKYEIVFSLGERRRPAGSNVGLDEQRARELHRDFSLYLEPHSEILDYGGNDGRLVVPFLADGHRCYIVDYAKNSIDGVVRLASVIAEVPAERIFDAVVVSHVLEHVAEPLQLLSSLRAHHVEGGAIYVEVPMELWGAIPPGKDPVTHINYFTPPVLERLLRNAGYSPTRCDLKWHYVSKWSLVVRAIARNYQVPPENPHVTGYSVEYSRSMMRSTFRGLLRIVGIERQKAPYVAAYIVLRGLKRKLKRGILGVFNKPQRPT